MSFQTVPTLQQLIIRVLLCNEDLVLSALEDLPSVFFPQLFKEAFLRHQSKIVKHLVATWPYPKLYIGPLKYEYDLYNFKGVFDGIEWLNGQKICPRRYRLREIYVLDHTHDFLIIMNPRQDHHCIPEPQPEEEDPTTVLRQPITVYADSAFMVDRLKCHRDSLKQSFSQRWNAMSLYFKEMVPQKKVELEQSISSLGVSWGL